MKLLIVFCLIPLIVIGIIIICIGVGIGFILSKLITGLTLGMGIIAGAIFSIGIIDYWIKFISAVGGNQEIFNYENDHLKDEEPFVIFPPQYSKTLRKKRKKKKNT